MFSIWGEVRLSVQGFSMWGGHYIKIPYIGDVIYIYIFYVEWPLHKDSLYVEAIYICTQGFSMWGWPLHKGSPHEEAIT